MRVLSPPQDLQMGLQHRLQQLQQSVDSGADSRTVEPGGSGVGRETGVGNYAGESGEVEESAAAAEARRKAEDAEAAAQQRQLERVEAIGAAFRVWGQGLGLRVCGLGVEKSGGWCASRLSTFRVQGVGLS